MHGKFNCVKSEDLAEPIELEDFNPFQTVSLMEACLLDKRAFPSTFVFVS